MLERERERERDRERERERERARERELAKQLDAESVEPSSHLKTSECVTTGHRCRNRARKP